MLNNFQSPGEIAFELFSFPIYYYGIIMALAVFVGVFCAYLLYQNVTEKQDSSVFFDIMPIVIIMGILGARLYYCLLNFSYYVLNPFEILNIRQGGLSIHGMIFIGICSLFLFAKFYKISFLKMLDCFACATPLAQSIGRWGNFFNSEAFGLPTELPWKLYIPIHNRPLEYINFEYFHPTFLYESVLDFIIFLILFGLFRKFSGSSGIITCLYLILYSIVRFFIEYLRVDSALNVFGIPIAQIVSVLIFISALFILIKIKKLN